MQAHEHLTIVEACRDLVLRSAAAVDTNDARRVADLFVEDGELVRPNGETMRGRDAIRASYAPSDPPIASRGI